MKLYEILGVTKDASQEEIKRAHREAVKIHHPDKGGDPEVFAAVQHAYEVLSDEVRRKKYDETGDDKKVVDNFINEFASFVQQTILNQLEDCDDLEFDVIGKSFEVINRYTRDGEAKIAQTQRKLKHIESIKGRFVRTDGEQNLMEMMIDSRLSNLRRGIESMNREMELLGRFHNELSKYDYKFDSQKKEISQESYEKISVSIEDWLNDMNFKTK